MQELEQKLQQNLQHRQQLKMVTELKQDQETKIQRSQEKKARISAELAALGSVEGLTKERLQEEIRLAEQQCRELVRKKTSLRERIIFIQRQIDLRQKEWKMLQDDLAIAPEKERLQAQVTQEIAQKGELQEKKKQLEDLFEKTVSLITQNQTLLTQAKEMQSQIKTLNTCPTCLQQVTTWLKEKICEQEAEKIKPAENLLFELHKKRSEIWQQKEQLLSKIEEIIRKENLATRLSVELQRLAEKQELMVQKKEELQGCVQENNHLMAELALLEKGVSEEQLTTFLGEKQKQAQQLTKIEYLLRSEQEEQRVLVEGIARQEELERQREMLAQQITTEDQFQPQIEQLKKNLLELQNREKEARIQRAQVQTRVEILVQQKQRLEETIVILSLEKEKLIRIQELHHWLETFFINVTLAMEKHVMVTIHRRFHQLFQEWFSALVNDETILGRIDDTFTPLIEQNGYEISFANLSGGERTSAALAYRLALNRVINDVIHTIKTKDLLILDEPTEGFSSDQLDKIRDVLERLGLQQILIVSHESKIESFVENVIRIQKEGHVSRVLT